MSSVVKMLLFRPHLWIAARWLPVGAKRRSIEQLLARAMPLGGYAPYRGLDPELILAAVRATTARPWRMRGRRCLREGLLGFRFLRLAGFAPVLHFGVEPESVSTDHLRAHCWITLADSCVLNPPSDTMVRLFSWDGEKRLAPSTLESTNSLIAASRSYNLNGLTLSVIAPDQALCACLESFLAPLAVDARIATGWEVRISREDTLPNLQAGELVWEGDLPEGLPAVMRRDGADRNLLVRDHLALSTDRRRKRIDVVVRPGREKTLRGTPSVSIVAEIIRGSGLFLTHSACLLLPRTDECILIFAPSGTGKTTTSLALARSGWRLVGDDATILQMHGTELRVWALPRGLTVHRRTEELLPWLTDAINPWAGKAEQSVPLRSVSPFIGHATPVPRRCRATVMLDMPNGSAHMVFPIDRSEALLRILSDNLRIAPDGMGDYDRSLLDAFAALVKHTMLLRLSVGPDLQSLGSYLTGRVQPIISDSPAA